jgi:ADP-ribosyl-[dinitrogen reductase] hydrolase
LAALWAFDRGGDFPTGALLAVNLGDDADTTGAIYGQIARACYAVQEIPAEWRQCLAERETLRGYADLLLTLSEQVDF